MIHKCTCHSPYQDKQYGKGNRVFNPKGKGKTGKQAGIARCTVCSTILTDTVDVQIWVKPDVV